MTFNDLLKFAKQEPRYAFFLGMIYGWPTAKDGTISACFELLFDARSKRINQIFSPEEIENLNKENVNAIFSFVNNTMITRKDIQITANAGSFKCDVNFVDTDNLDSENTTDRAIIYGKIEKSLMEFSEQSKTYFISGMFNARGSLDFTANFIAIDIEAKRFPQFVKRKYWTISNIAGAFYNYNPRLLQGELSNKKNDQLRPKLDLFVSVFGLFLPFKKRYFEKMRNVKMFEKDGLFFYGYDISRIKDFKGYARGLEINKLAIDFSNNLLTETDLLKKRIELGLDNDDDLDILLHANPNVKEERKRLNDYLCEINRHHRTFIAKINSRPFVEGHHLIPFAKRQLFDVNIDIVENIVALCPVCHRQIHLGIDQDRFSMLDELYDRNIDGLRGAGINITKADLFGFYK